MKFAMITVLMLAGAPTAEGKSGEMRAKVAVCMDTIPGEPSDMSFVHAKMMATLIFDRIGLKLEWRDPSTCPQGAIRISLSDKTPMDFHPKALAYAEPFEGTHIVVFWDRIHQNVCESRVSALLAHVLAHEMVHIFQGLTRHSATGLMKAHWGPCDFDNMAVMPLPFTTEDIDLIWLGLARRESLVLAGAR